MGRSDNAGPCCAPARPGDTTTAIAHPMLPRATTLLEQGLIDIPAGEFLMGTADPADFPADGEGPVRPVIVRPFRIARYAVTNDQFAAFVAATGYTTEAERFGWSFVFRLLVPRWRGIEIVGTAGPAPWWVPPWRPNSATCRELCGSLLERCWVAL